MTRFRLCLASLLLCVLVPALHAQQTGLRALDTDHEARGWEAIGRIDTDIGYCSATLIAPDLVLTAAHCVYNLNTGAAVEASKMRFRAGYRNGTAVAERRVAQVAAHPGFKPRGTFSRNNIEHDVALLRLTAPIPTSQINPFVLHADRIERGPVSIVSYGRGRSEVQSRERGCRMTDRRGDMLVFDCDITNGSSGAPVFSHLNGRGRIMSVISAEVRHEGRDLALGMHLPERVSELKRMLAAAATGPVARANRVPVTTGGGIRFQGVGNAGGAKFVRVPSP